MLQKIDLIGNLVQDAEVKSSKDGKEFVTFRVAANDGPADDRKTTYYDVTFTRNGLLQYLKKGQCVFVSGRLSLSAVLRDDKAFLNAYVGARDVVLVGGSRND